MTAVKDKLIYRFPKSIITQQVDKNEKKVIRSILSHKIIFNGTHPKKKKLLLLCIGRASFRTPSERLVSDTKKKIIPLKSASRY